MINLNITPGSSSTGDGIDVTSVVNQILDAERGPERLMQNQQSQITSESAMLNRLSVNLNTLKDKVNSLKDVTGALSGMTATSSQETVFTASAQSTAAAGSHLVVVGQLATTSSAYSDALASSSAQFSTGTLSLQLGLTPVDITVDSQINTIDGLVSYINAHSYGVTASVIQDANGSRLALVSKTSGLPGDITITNNTTGLNLTRVAGQNASVTIDGVPISSASNTIAGALSGVTLNLASAAPGAQLKLDVSPDTAKAKQAIVDFVAAYNTLITAINGQFAVNASTNAAGPLASNSSLRALQTNLLSDVTYSITGNNGLISLASLGINMNNDGTLTTDNSKLDSVLAGQFTDVVNLFQSLSSDGFARHFGSDLNSLTDSTQGLIAINLTQNASTLTMLSDEITEFEARMSVRQKQLTDQYSRIDILLRQYPLLMSQVTQQLGVLSQNTK
jgi:flagellar hook-associated protein 2